MPESIEEKIDALAKRFEEKEGFIERWEKKYQGMSTFKKIVFWLIVIPAGYYLMKFLKKKLEEMMQDIR